MKIRKSTLKKMELVFEELEYEVLYEKGNFQSGYCIVEDQRIIVINKFYDLEARLNSLLDILDRINYDSRFLSKNSRKFLFQLTKGEDNLHQPTLDL